MTIVGFRIGNRIYCTILDLATTVYRSLPHTDKCSHSRCLIAAANGGHSSVSGLTSLQTGYYLTPTHTLIAVFSWYFLQLLAKSKSKLYYARPSVEQSVLVSSTHLGLKARFFFCLTVAGLLMWGALSDERTGVLQRAMYNIFKI
jgi:hypothetical protein